jgi:hypothetical protein
MHVGIIGFARSGKTTIFNALTGATAAVGTFGSREANVAMVKVPDERVDKLAELYKPKKKTFAEFRFVDVAPAESAADKALDEAALRELKSADALVHAVRCFDNPDVLHPLGKVDPVRDCNVLQDELVLNDLAVVEKRLERLTKENKKDREFDVLTKLRVAGEDGQPFRTVELTTPEVQVIAGFGFLSIKPLMLLGNYGEESIGKEDPSGLTAFAAENGFALVELCGAMEMEVSQLAEDEREAFRQDLGLGEESRTRFLKTAYGMLGLMSFLTAGEPEVRAWTIRKNTRAVDAANVIHSDIARGFIRAETVAYDDLIATGSMAKAKEKGHVRLEGKEYIMQDGDVVHFRFNV